MYELICPSCDHMQTSSFVRVGAVVPCPSCKRQFRIESKHIRHTVTDDDQAGQDLTMSQPLSQENAPMTGAEPQQATADEAQPRPAPPQPADPQSKPRRKSVIAAAVIIIVVLIALVIVLGTQLNRHQAPAVPTMADPPAGPDKVP